MPDIAGDLYMSGPLARGYLGDAALTAERFVPDPDGPPGSRLYCTGDVGRLMDDGRIEYLGPGRARLRFNGRTIDAGDVEHALCSLDSVRQAVVACFRDAADQPRLTVWLVVDQRQHEAVAQALRRALDDLPIATAWRFMDRVPLTRNGEVDCAALPAIDERPHQTLSGFVAPRTETELTLARIWGSVLGIADVGLTDDFYDLGGDSIASIQIVVQARRAGLELTVQQVLEQPTVLQQARSCVRMPSSDRVQASPTLGGVMTDESIDEPSPSLRERRAGSDVDVYPLTPMQAGMLFHSLMAPGSGMYIQQMGCTIDGDLDANAFEASWRLAMSRHAILRTSFRLEDGDEPVQLVHAASGLSVPIQWLDWQQFEPTARQMRLSALLSGQRRIGFPPEQPPLFSVTVIRTAAACHELVVAFHHALLDGWSMSTLLDDFFAGYAAYRAGTEPVLAPAADLRPYFEWVATRDRGEAETFWRQHLVGFHEPTPVPGVSGAKLPAPEEAISLDVPGRLSRSLDAVCTAELHAVARRTRTTVSTVLHAAWGLLLSRYAGESDVAFGITVAGRTPDVPRVEEMVGLFINTLPLRMHVAPTVPLWSWVAEIGATMRAMRRFEHSALSDIQRGSEIQSGTPLFTSIFVVENYPVSRALKDSRSILEFGPPWVEGKVNYPLAVVVVPGPTLRIELLYDRGVISSEHAEQLLAQYTCVVSAMVRGPDRLVGEIALLPPEQHDTVVHHWNRTEREWPNADGRLDQAFARQVLRTPEGTALVEGSRSVTYRELDHQAAALARRLQARKIGTAKCVGIYLERSIELVVALIAVAKAGAAYVPLEPDSPPERISFVLRDADVQWVITTRRLSARLPSQARAVRIDGADGPEATGTSSPEPMAPASCLAYVLYTSGSTGRPKGVAISHQAAMNHMLWFNAQWSMEDERVLFKTPITFDASGWEVWAPLLAGGTIVVAPPDAHRHPEEILSSIRDHAATVIQVVPPLLDALLNSGGLSQCVTLRRIFCGGESLPGAFWNRLVEQSTAELVNLYGPTETTIDTTYQTCTGEPTEVIPIGRPIANVRVYVLDDNMLPLPIGARGELYIGGAGVARGYVGRPDQTAERFLPNPFGGPGTRLYRTGDRVQWNADGSLHYLGRLDSQLKIRGHRVEPGEIEAVIRRIPGIREVVVVAREDEAALRQLVAYLVAHSSPRPVEELRDSLARTLPDAMIPSHWVWLDALPLTPSGKVDRRALPALEAPQPHVPPDNEPRNEVERLLRDVFCEVMHLPICGIHDNFFEIGGDSILSLKLVARVRRKGLNLRHRDLFSHPTIAELAACVGGVPSESPAATAPLPRQLLPLVPRIPGVDLRQIEEAFELTALQEGMLFHSLYADAGDMYVQQVRCMVCGPLQDDRLAKALHAAVRRHPTLRTSFHLQAEPRPLQAVWVDAEPECARLDFRDLSADERGAAIQAFLDQDSCRPFELTRPPLLRLTTLRTGLEEHVLILSFHHALLDGWSLGLLMEEIFATYRAMMRGTPPVIERSASMKSFVEMARAEGRESAAALAARVRGASGSPYLPIALATAYDTARAKERRAVRVLSPESSAAIQAVARQRWITVASFVHAAWGILLSRYSGRDDVVFGSTFVVRPAEMADAERSLGLFINTLPVRLRVRGDVPAGHWLDHVHAEITWLRQFEHSPLSEVQRLVSGGRAESLFDTLLVVENLPLVDVAWQDLALHVSDIAVSGRTNYALTILVIPGPSLTIEAHYPEDRLVDAKIERLLSHFSRLLVAIATAPDVPVDAQPMLDPDEHNQLVAAAGMSPPLGEPGDTLHGLVERQRRLSPDRIIVLAGARGLTFASLDEQAGALADRLRRLGVGSETAVAVQMQRSPEMVIALLGVLKAGGAYVPLDPEAPSERVRILMDRVGARILLATSEVERPSGIEVVSPVVPAVANPQAVAAHGTGESAAYVIYTSGSTGEPKAVVNCQRGIVNRLLWMRDALGFDEHDRVLQKTPYTFDVSLWDIFMPLVTGACLVLAPPGIYADPDRIIALIEEYGITVLHFVPSLLAEFLPRASASACRSLRCVVCSGEALSPGLAERFFAALPGVELYNLYGPTEAAVDVSMWRCRPGQTVVPIGHPISGVQVHVLGPDGEPTSTGSIGEIHIGGIAVARGYASSPALTADRFIPDRLTRRSGDRLYKTGDYGRRRDDGAIEFLGRMDRQVKIRGVRIEPGEVEAVLATHPAVLRSVVVARSFKGQSHLVAYIEGVRDERGNTALDAELRRYLEKRLPLGLVPSVCVFVDVLPTTPSGKLDPTRLPEPVIARRSEETAPPASETEKVLAPIWADVLGLQRVNALDNFFDLGGESLAAARLMARVAAALSVRLPVRDLFAAPTLRTLAARIDAATRTDLETDRVPDEDAMEVPLSHAQQRLWFLDQLHPGSCEYHVPMAARLRGLLDPDVVERVLNVIGDRHAILRTRFIQRNGKPFGKVDARAMPRYEFLDLSNLPADAQDVELRQSACTFAKGEFDLASEHAWRALLVKLADDHHALILTLHHIVCDHVSLQVILREFASVYEAAMSGRVLELPPLPAQYAQFAKWQRERMQGERLERLLSFWTNVLTGPLPVLSLPNRLRPLDGREAGGATCVGELPTEVSSAVRRFGREHGCTPYMTWLAAWNVVLSRYTSQTDIVLGTPVGNRPLAAFESLVGPFVNTLVLRTDLSDNPSFSELLRRVRADTLAAWDHQELPFELLVTSLQPERDLRRTPLFQVFFDLLGAENIPAIDDLDISPFDVDYGIARFDLSLFIKDHGSSFSLFLEYAQSRFERDMAERLVSSLLLLMRTAVENPTIPISRLPILEARERHDLLQSGVVMEVGTASVRERLAAQAAQRPEAVAISQHGAASVTYRELETRARSISRHLLAQGFRPEQPVGVMTERSSDLVAAMLGVLGAGGAYVPIDPHLPLRRCMHILKQADVRLLLCDTPRRAEDLQRELTVIDVNQISANNDNAMMQVNVAPGQLAYILFTSGSTGAPKGAMVEHAALVNHLFARKIPGLEISAEDVLAQTASQSFDISVWQLLTALAVGGRVRIIGDRIVRDPFLLLQELEEAEVTITEIVPSLLRALLSAIDVLGTKRPPLHRLRHLVLGGEALPSVLCATWHHWYPHVTITNGYGPTECADDVAVHVVETLVDTLLPSVPIGRPIPNMRIYLLDRELELVPPGVLGEVYVAGRGVGRGYVHDPARTAEVFLPDIAGHEPGARMYRTGDLARRTASGELVFLGRVDQQVKLRGYRIELPEIETVLQRHPGVRQAVAGMWEPSAGRSELIAWIVPSAGAEVNRDELRTFAVTWLPDYMVPGNWIFVPELPLNANGKVDRTSLPYPDPTVAAMVSADADERVQPVLALMCEVLGGPLHASDDFFRAGGHSLLAVELTHRLSEHFAVLMPLVAIFEHPTATGLADWIHAQRKDASVSRPPAPADEGAEPAAAPATAAQLGAWLLHENWPNPASLNVWFAVRIGGLLNVGALRQTFAELAARHDALRAGFTLVDGTPAMVFDQSATIEIVVRDLSELRADERQQALHEQLSAEVLRPFDLRRPPLVRALLIREAREEHVFCIVAHHIILDGWSTRVLSDEAAVLYNAFVVGKPSPLAPPRMRFSDFAWRERVSLLDGAWDEQASWWLDKLGGSGECSATAEGAVSTGGVQTARLRRSIDPEIARRLIDCAREVGCTPFVAWLATLAVALQHRFGTDIRVATPVANREGPHAGELVGLLMNTVVMRIDVSAQQSFLQLLEHVRGVVRDALRRQDYPFDLLVRRLYTERHVDPLALAPVLFIFDSEGRQPMPFAGLELREIQDDADQIVPAESLPLGYAVALFAGIDSTSWTAEFQRDRFSLESASALIDDIANIARRVVQEPDRPVLEASDR
jgi:amino acid adenylation domain-containing protein